MRLLEDFSLIWTSEDICGGDILTGGTQSQMLLVDVHGKRRSWVSFRQGCMKQDEVGRSSEGGPLRLRRSPHLNRRLLVYAESRRLENPIDAARYML